MKHLVLCEQGTFLGTTGERLTVRKGDEVLAEHPLSRLRTVTIAKPGVSVSGNALLACAARGIGVFLSGYADEMAVAVCGAAAHAVAAVRRAQFAFAESDRADDLSARILYGKIRNQRAVVCYFGKYARKDPERAVRLDAAAQSLKQLADALADEVKASRPDWRNRIMGIEGQAASIYWDGLTQSGLLPPVFPGRKGRGATDTVNAALNYGYAILRSQIWHAVLIAGLEPYVGVLHVDRPGKPSLVLDLMEEYRPWVVDRTVIKMRSTLQQSKDLAAPIRKQIAAAVLAAFEARTPYRGKKLSLSSILQRQVYRLSGHFMGRKAYRPLLFKW